MANRLARLAEERKTAYIWGEGANRVKALEPNRGFPVGAPGDRRNASCGRSMPIDQETRRLITGSAALLLGTGDPSRGGRPHGDRGMPSMLLGCAEASVPKAT
jgi:hypothetical protein